MHINSTWSQHQEDLQLVRHFFCDICEASRTYVEIGALDGVRFSNTMLLEHQFNFGGLLIEGHPFSAQCLVAARGRSGRNLVINEAVCDPPGSVTFVGAPIAMAGDRATMASGFHDKWKHLARLDDLNFSVPCRPIGAMLRLAGLETVHFFSLDVEGAELRVLQTMDWSIPVHVWMVELDGTNPQKDSDVRALLGSRGYLPLPRDIPFTNKYLNEIFIHHRLAPTAAARSRLCQTCVPKSAPPHPGYMYHRSSLKVDNLVRHAGKPMCYEDALRRLGLMNKE